MGFGSNKNHILEWRKKATQRGVVIFFAALAVLLPCFLASPASISERWGFEYQYSPAADPLALGEDWIPLAAPVALPGDKGSVWYRIRFPKGASRDEALAIEVLDQCGAWFADDNYLGSFALDDNGNCQAKGYPIHLLRFPQRDPGKTILIHVMSTHTNLGIYGDVFLGTTEEVLRFFLRRDSQMLLVASFLFLTGVGLMILALFSRRDMSLVLGWFHFVVGCYLFFHSSIRVLYTLDPKIWLDLEVYFFGMGVASAYGLFWRFSGVSHIPGSRLLAFFSGGLAAWHFAVLAVRLMGADVPSLSISLLPAQATLPLLIPFGAWFLGNAWRKGYSPRLPMILPGVIFGGALATWEIGGRLHQWSLPPFSTGHWAILGFISGFFRVFLTESLEGIQEKGVLAERARNEALVTQNARLSALGEMAGGVAHEINNPLAVIQGRANQLSRLLEAPVLDKERLLKLALSIEGGATRIARIVRGLRFISREAAGDPLEKASLQKIIEETQDLCSERFKNHGVELRIQDIPPEAHWMCRPAQMGQVLLNLLNNAHDAVEGKEAPWVEIRVAKGSSCWDVTVRDAGSGIPSEVVHKLFQPFFTTKPVGKGTGIGLSVSESIVAGHGGQLRYELSEGHTAFVVSLPCEVENSENPEKGMSRIHGPHTEPRQEGANPSAMC